MKSDPASGVATNDISSREVDVSEPESTTGEESVEGSREKKQEVLVLILVLLAIFVLAIVLLLWYDGYQKSVMITRESERY